MDNLFITEQNIFHGEAEYSVLAYYLNETEYIKESPLEPGFFYLQSNQIFFQAMLDLIKKGQPVDKVTLDNQLGEEGKKAIGTMYFTELVLKYNPKFDVKAHELIIIEKWKVRATGSVLRETLDVLKEDNKDYSVTETIRKLQKIDENGVEKDEVVSSVISKLIDKHENGESTKQNATTGFKSLDLLLGGLKPSKLTYLGGRPGSGKTTLAMNIASHVAHSEGISMFFSLEMKADELLERMICSYANISSFKLGNPQKRFSQDDWTKYHKATGFISSLDESMKIYDNGHLTMKDVYTKVRRMRVTNKDKKIVVFVDYIGLMDVPGIRPDNKNAQMTEISRALKLMAMDLNVSVVALTQLNRGLESREDKRPMMSDMRDSGSLEQDADNVIFVYREYVYSKQEADKNKAEINIAKQRGGATGTIDMIADMETYKFLDMPR